MNTNTRKFEALEYQKIRNAKLTTKQYLVYSYLVSISKWNAVAKEDHYYVYKNSFVIKDACKLLGITNDTWRLAIRRLYELGYISYDFEIAKDKNGTEYHKEKRDNKAYIIRIINTYAPLSIDLIKFLVKAGAVIMKITNTNIGGNIVSVYSLIYSYWYKKGNDICEINVNQLKNIYSTTQTKEDTIAYRLMLGYFYSTGLMDFSTMTKTVANSPYISYHIKSVRLDLPEILKREEIGMSDISDILKTLKVDCLDTFSLEQDTRNLE